MLARASNHGRHLRPGAGANQTFNLRLKLPSDCVLAKSQSYDAYDDQQERR
jgi:hypothetical protein